MQKSVRYYIVKADERPVVRSVPVAQAVGVSPAASGAESSPTRTERPERPETGVSRLVRAAIRRRARQA